MRPQVIAAITAATLLGVASCSSSATSTPPTHVDFASLETFCTDVGAYATELTEGKVTEPAAQNFVDVFKGAADRIDAADPNHPDMATVAASITSVPVADLWPVVAKGQAYCVSAGAPVISGSPYSAP